MIMYDSKSKDIILEINFNFSHETLKRIIKGLLGFVFKIFLPLFSFFDKLAEKRKLVISSFGLGIGLGLSIIITQRPDALQAFPNLVNQMMVGVEVKTIEIPKIDLSLNVRHNSLNSFVENVVSNELIHIDGSGYLGQNKPMVVADLSSKNLLMKIEGMGIGDEIVAIGKNNGTYKYRVIEIRETESQYLPHVIAKEENSLILYKSQNLIRTRVFIIVAKPYR